MCSDDRKAFILSNCVFGQQNPEKSWNITEEKEKVISKKILAFFKRKTYYISMSVKIVKSFKKREELKTRKNFDKLKKVSVLFEFLTIKKYF